jgi:hypothetical protein
MSKLREFYRVYRLYRRAGHSVSYCFDMAFGIAFIGRQF